MHRIANIDNVKPARRRHVEPMPGGGDKRCARQHAVGIETDRVVEEIVIRIAVHQGGDVRDDESLFTIRHVNKRVEEIDRLFFVFWNVQTPRIQREGAWQSDTRRVFRVDAGALAERRNRRADDAFRETFLVDVSTIEGFITVGLLPPYSKY